MLADNDNYDDGYEPRILGASSVADIRRHALIVYGRWLAHLNNATSDDEKAAARQKYLSLKETEHIVFEHCEQYDENMFAIGGETEEDVHKKMREIMAALMDRIMSNVLQEGVNTGLLECAYDGKANDFTFEVTEEGKKRAREYLQKRHDDAGN